ncbi:unnamed protein product [marine sediment metagenome]|uniref:Uncharacterized protein n=1 Tax=marine sediment metagenome TaxID=412755 RepID=X1NG77_9ZZZZ
MFAPELTDRSLAEETVYNYWQAIINRQYGLAKCYCITGGIWDNKVDEWEEYIYFLYSNSDTNDVSRKTY